VACLCVLVVSRNSQVDVIAPLTDTPLSRALSSEQWLKKYTETKIFTEAIPLCDIISIYIYIYFHVINNNSKTHKLSATN